ncbi:MAG: Lrp/AsnC family transcriptional regulator [Chloracidobacterium sp.]|nr:Lrp/AsnC family transcriptional regulator [Chloracidobacterium sp.]MCC6826539.1 Lrp/AsnC family transcriptional regulator [Acidobacteriota bacterium]MCO5333404.1 Lrp/AsnC family transcriptional regulator [Pyrinomonadaceae bacterium]
MIDDTDHQILRIVQYDARISNADIARKVGLAPSAVHERVRKLEERGVICGYEARIDHRQFGLGMLAFVFVKSREWGDGTDEALAKIPEVLEIHDVAGEDSFLLKVRAGSPEGLAKLLREKIKAVPTVLSTRTTVVLETIKETSSVPVACENEPSAGGKKKKVKK